MRATSVLFGRGNGRLAAARFRVASMTGAIPVLWLVAALSAQTVPFAGDVVARTLVQSHAEFAQLQTLTDDIWTHTPALGEIDARFTPAQLEQLAQSGLPYAVLIDDIPGLLAGQLFDPRGGDPFDHYMPPAELATYINDLAAFRPDLAQRFVAGRSVEGREIVGLRISGRAGFRPGVLFHGGQHAREWITVPTALFIADRLIRRYDSDPYVRELVNRAEWLIIPVMNPDGYEYSWTEDRLWRKNRRNNGDGSFGVDNNRNWGFQWSAPGGASTIPRDEDYRGPAPFSEPETRAIRDLIFAQPNLVAYCDIHSYSQLIMWPWGYTESTTPDQAAFAAIGRRMQERIRASSGLIYGAGSITTVLYPASGSSIDWVYGERDVLALALELRDRGAQGFLLGPDQIRPTCEEIYSALIDYADQRTAAVRIEFPGGPPAALPPGTPTTLRVRITPNAEAVDPAAGRLYFRGSPVVAFESVALSPAGGDEYLATFPARACGTPTQWYIATAGALGTPAFAPTGAPANSFSTPIAVVDTLAQDDFETDTSWTVTNTQVTGGAWVRVDPIGTITGGMAAQPADDNPAGIGTFCFVTGQGAPSAGPGSADLDGGPTILTSPLVAIPAGADPTLRYARWFFNMTQGLVGDDAFLVEVSGDDGASWIEAERVTHQPAWVQRSIRVRSVLPELGTSLRVRFVASDNPNNSLHEAAVDDIVIERLRCERTFVAADVDCSGRIDFDDINAFVLALAAPAGYAAAYPACDIVTADCDASGQVDFDDIAAFVALLAGA